MRQRKQRTAQQRTKQQKKHKTIDYTLRGLDIAMIKNVAISRPRQEAPGKIPWCFPLLLIGVRKMKFVIKHEIKGRMRIHVSQYRMSYEQADTLLYFLHSNKYVTFAKVYERTGDAVISYVGDRTEMIRTLQQFSYEKVDVPAGVIENSGRELNAKYQEKLIGKIEREDADAQFILIGDVIDRGPDGIKVLQDMAQRLNVITILGNHELDAALCIPKLLQEVTDESIAALSGKDFAALSEWLQNGGGPTLRGLQQISPAEREELLDYLRNMQIMTEHRMHSIRRFSAVMTGTTAMHIVRLPISEWIISGLTRIPGRRKMPISCSNFTVKNRRNTGMGYF